MAWSQTLESVHPHQLSQQSTADFANDGSSVDVLWSIQYSFWKPKMCPSYFNVKICTVLLLVFFTGWAQNTARFSLMAAIDINKGGGCQYFSLCQIWKNVSHNHEIKQKDKRSCDPCGWKRRSIGHVAHHRDITTCPTQWALVVNRRRLWLTQRCQVFYVNLWSHKCKLKLNISKQAYSETGNDKSYRTRLSLMLIKESNSNVSAHLITRLKHDEEEVCITVTLVYIHNRVLVKNKSC